MNERKKERIIKTCIGINSKKKQKNKKKKKKKKKQFWNIKITFSKNITNSLARLYFFLNTDPKICSRTNLVWPQ